MRYLQELSHPDDLRFKFRYTIPTTLDSIPDSKVHGANMGPIWGRQDPGGAYVGPMNFAIWDRMSSGWHIALARSHPDEMPSEAKSAGLLKAQISLCHPDAYHTTLRHLDDLALGSRPYGLQQSQYIRMTHVPTQCVIRKSSAWDRNMLNSLVADDLKLM